MIMYFIFASTLHQVSFHIVRFPMSSCHDYYMS
jgi:hypothetical protein